MPSFNLTTQPWIPVLLKDGTALDVSLLSAVRQAPEIARLGGNPLEAAVLHRLLLAIAHRVRNPGKPEEWLELWGDRKIFLQEMSQYLQVNADKFELYDVTRPFGQHPGLADPQRSPAELVYDRARGNNPVFLDGSVVNQPHPISSALAARALLVTHAFSGSGTGGLNPLNQNKKDTMYAGALCARMIAVLEGEDLSQTLLYNLAINKPQGRPCWERSLCGVPTQTRPEGVCDIYTRCTRNIKLQPNSDGTECVAVSVVMGEGLAIEEGGTDDPLIPVKSGNDKKFKAVRVNPQKALWRNASNLLLGVENERARPLSSIAHIQAMKSYGKIKDRGEVRLRTLGVAANAQGPVTEMWRDESLTFSLSLFDEENRYPDLLRAITSADSEADKLRFEIKNFATRYVANGGIDPHPNDVARQIEEMAPGLNDFWAEIGPKGERLASFEISDTEWTNVLFKARKNAFVRAVNRLAPDARRLRAEFEQTTNGTTRGKLKKEKE